MKNFYYVNLEIPLEDDSEIFSVMGDRNADLRDYLLDLFQTVDIDLSSISIEEKE